MTERSIVVRLRAVVSDFRRDMDEASNAVKKNGQSINTLSNGAGLLGIAMVSAAALAVKSFADFDESMSAVQAATHESAGAMGDLRDAALDAGARTKYSATEAASGIEELAKAGVSTADILGGALDGSLNLAAAGAIGVGDAAEIAATAMTQFGLKGDQVTHIADLLAAGAGKAQGGVGDLGMALKQAGLVANSTGLSIEETTAGLAAFASAGLIGSDAGTSFKSMLQRLTPQSKEAQRAMDELGISAYDSQGNFIGLAEFAGNLQGALKDLTPEQRNAAQATIFGSDAVRASNILYEQGEKGIRDWTTAVDEQGYAAETAALRMDNLKGDIEQLGGSIETALIKTGEGANGPLRDLVQSATDAVSAFGELDSGVQATLLGIVGVGGLALLGAAGIAKLVVGVNEAKLAMAALGISAKTATIATAAIGGALAVATIGISAWADAQAQAEARVTSLRDSLDKTTGAITGNTREVIANDLASRKGWWVFKQDSVKQSAEMIGLSLGTVTDAILGNKDALDEVNAATKAAVVGTKEHDAIVTKVGDDWVKYGTAQKIVREQVAGLTGALGESKTTQEAVNEAVGGGTEQTLAATAATEAATAATADATEALDNWRQMVHDSDAEFVALDEAYQGVIDKNIEYATSTADATEDSSDSWEDYYDGVAVSAGEYIAGLQAQVDAQSAWESNVLAISERVKTGMTGDMKAAAEGMIDELIDLGPRGAAQVELLRNMSDEQFAQVVTLWSQKGASAVAEFTSSVEAYRHPIIDLTVNPDPAYGVVDKFFRDVSGRTISLNSAGQSIGFTTGVGNPIGRASGGPVKGPGTSTSDSIPAYLSNGEYVIKADTVTKYGTAFFDSLNAQRFAQGGRVAAGGSMRAAAETRGASASSPRSVPLVNVGTMVAADTGAAVRYLTTKLTDVVTTHGLAGVI